MDKAAQQRSFFSKVRDVANISGRLLEEVNIEFATVMGRLRESDADIREDAIDLKQLATNAVKLVRARHYLDTAVNIAAFHERCRVIAAKMDKFNKSVDIRHLDYLLDQLSDSDKEKLFKYNPDADIKLDKTTANFDTSFLIKQAGFTDWLFESGNADPSSKQNSAMKSLEKRFKIPLLKNLKAQSISMTERTYQFFKYLIQTFKKLGWAISIRKVDQYVALSNEFIRKFAEYHAHFTKYYEVNIKPLKEHQEKLKADQAAKTETSKLKVEAPPARSPFPQSSQSPFNAENPGTQGQLFPFDQTLHDETNRAPLFPQPGPKRLDRDNPGTKGEPRPISPTPEENIPVENLRDRLTMLSFIAKLEKLASKNQSEQMISEILKQSAELEDTNVEQSMQLLSIAEGMLEDKTAGIFDFLNKKDKEDAAEDEKRLPLQDSLR